MHDPCTVAFDIKYPWSKHPKGHRLFPEGYRETFITIWHRDPELDGSDDSCGWSYVRRLTDEQKKLCRELAEWEMNWPYYFARPARAINPEYPSLKTISPGDAAALTLATWQTFAWRLFRENLSPHIAMRALTSGVAPEDNYQGTFTLDDSDHLPAVEQMEYRFRTLLRGYLTARRRWWQHPRWHVRHWEFQVRPVQGFKRWAFTRCAVCGGRFKWGQSGVGTWDGGGPMWFRSEHLTHMDCSRASVVVPPMARAASPITREE